MTDFEQELRGKGYLAYTSTGNSMMPLLREHRDVIIIRKIDTPPKKNDVVLFKRSDGTFVLHRIIRSGRHGCCRIAGDNCLYSEVVPEERIIGILSEIIRDGRRISMDSSENKAYVRSVPLRRMRLVFRRLLHKIRE